MAETTISGVRVIRGSGAAASAVTAGMVPRQSSAGATEWVAPLTLLASSGGAGMQVFWWDPITNAPIWVAQPLKEDWMTGSQAGAWNWVAATAVTTGTVAVDVYSPAFGALQLATGTGTGGAITKRLDSARTYFGSGTARLLMALRTPAAVSDGTDTYTIYAGFIDADNAEPVDGAYFVYSHGVNSGNWLGRTSNNSSRTDASGGSNVAFTAAANWFLMIVATSTTVTFYVAPESATPGVPGTWVSIGSCAANIPSSSARATSIGAAMVKSAGTTSRSAYLGRVVYVPSR